METENKFKTLSQEFLELTLALYEDLSLIIQQMNINDSQTWRRLYIKSMVSAVEAQMHYLESHIKIIGEVDYLGLSEEEEQILYRKAGKDNKRKTLSFAERTAFLMNMFSEANYSPLTINKRSKDWNEYTQLIKIRNRLTHPAKPSDIKVTLKEVNLRKKF